MRQKSAEQDRGDEVDRTPELDFAHILNPSTLSKFGITRLCDLTGLDNLDLPVWAAVRPGSRSLCVSNGKGLTDRQAQLSAFMEAVEQASAEKFEDIVVEVCSTKLMRARKRTIVDLKKLARVEVRNISNMDEIAWVRGYELLGGKEVFAPYELIGLDFSEPSRWDRENFFHTSVGLAAGFDKNKILLHAILETIEEDALCNQQIWGRLLSSKNRREYNFNRRQCPSLEYVVRRLLDVGILPKFQAIGTVEGTFTFSAIIEDKSTRSSIAIPFEGSACRLSKEEAALAALLEAVQARMVAISGARDDFGKDLYDFKYTRNQTKSYMQCVFFDGPSKAVLPSHVDLEQVCRFLKMFGAKQVYVFPMVQIDPNIHCCRVLVPGLSCSGSIHLGQSAESRMKATLLSEQT